jgi:hypothetical protein
MIPKQGWIKLDIIEHLVNVKNDSEIYGIIIY